MPLINCEISIKLDWLKKYDTTFNTAANQAAKFAITDKIFFSSSNSVNSR